jgi:hypothetical protein
VRTAFTGSNPSGCAQPSVNEHFVREEPVDSLNRQTCHRYDPRRLLRATRSALEGPFSTRHSPLKIIVARVLGS